VDAIPHEYWTYYTSVLSPNPFYLFGLTGSQSAEQEMGRLKSEAVQVRHQLPFQSVSNFIDHYARLIDARRRSCEVMVARENLFLTVYADMYTGDQITTSKGYGVRVEDALKGEYEIYVKDALLKRRTVNFRAGGCKVMECSCQGPRLNGLPCRHVIAVNTYLTNNKSVTTIAFTEVFADMIPSFYKKGEYMKGYADVVRRPIIECIQPDETEPPQVDRRRGPPPLKRIPGRSEGGFSGPNFRKARKTNKNMLKFSVDATLAAIAAVPHTGTRSASTGIAVHARQLLDNAVRMTYGDK
jgi:hypothetical protein